MAKYLNRHLSRHRRAQWRLVRNGASIAAVPTDETRRVAADDDRGASRIRAGPITCAEQVLTAVRNYRRATPYANKLCRNVDLVAFCVG